MTFSNNRRPSGGIRASVVVVLALVAGLVATALLWSRNGAQSRGPTEPLSVDGPDSSRAARPAAARRACGRACLDPVDRRGGARAAASQVAIHGRDRAARARDDRPGNCARIPVDLRGAPRRASFGTESRPRRGPQLGGSGLRARLRASSQRGVARRSEVSCSLVSHARRGRPMERVDCFVGSVDSGGRRTRRDASASSLSLSP